MFMQKVRAKKDLGQHFLTDRNIAAKIVNSLDTGACSNVIEVGPGMGILTGYLLSINGITLRIVEIDSESVEYLHNEFPDTKEMVWHADFLKVDLNEIFKDKFSLIGNFPYNISSQIFFKVLENRNAVVQVVGMVQKEVAERISAGPGSKTYGILSVLLQTFYKIEYLFTVGEKVFSPPPKVKSAVIRLKRNQIGALPCDEKLFFAIIKASFNQRRKMLRNSLSAFPGIEKTGDYLTKRPEQLGVDDFIKIAVIIEKN